MSGVTGHLGPDLETPIWPTPLSISTATRAVPTVPRGCTLNCGSAWVSGSAASGSPDCCGSSAVAGSATGTKHRHRPAEAVHQDLVQRRFVAVGPDLLWCTDITEHPHPGREGLLRRGPRRLHPPDRGLVDRGPHALRTRRRCPADGDLATPSRARDRGTQRPRIEGSGTGSATPACSDPWAGSPPRWTTR